MGPIIFDRYKWNLLDRSNRISAHHPCAIFTWNSAWINVWNLPGRCALISCTIYWGHRKFHTAAFIIWNIASKYKLILARTVVIVCNLSLDREIFSNLIERGMRMVEKKVRHEKKEKIAFSDLRDFPVLFMRIKSSPSSTPALALRKFARDLETCS